MTYIQPLTFLCLVIMGAGLLLARHGKGVRLASSGLLALFLLSWPPVDWLFSWPLESRYSMEPFPQETAEAIVVLASATDPPKRERPYTITDRDGFRRCEHAAWLYKNWQALPILATGGSQTKDRPPVAATMRDLLVRAGVPNADILTEEISRSTHENAQYSAAILRKRGISRIALIVEAFAMPRAAAAFRKEGMTVVPAPYLFRHLGPLSSELLPSWKSMSRNEETLHEVLGLGWYRLRGWI